MQFVASTPPLEKLQQKAFLDCPNFKFAANEEEDSIHQRITREGVSCKLLVIGKKSMRLILNNLSLNLLGYSLNNK